MITVITPADSTALTLASTIQGHIGLDPGTDEQLFDDLIQSASDFIVEYTHRSFARQTIIELLAGEGQQGLILELTPIVSVTAIINNNNPITDFIIEDRDAGLLLRERGWDWSPSVGFGPNGVGGHTIPRTNYPKFNVEYTGGYILPTFNAGTPNLPKSIEQICIDIVRLWYGPLKDGLKPGSGPVEQIKVGDYSIKYGSGSSSNEDMGLPPEILIRLNTWRRCI